MAAAKAPSKTEPKYKVVDPSKVPAYRIGGNVNLVDRGFKYSFISNC